MSSFFPRNDDNNEYNSVVAQRSVTILFYVLKRNRQRLLFLSLSFSLSFVLLRKVMVRSKATTTATTATTCRHVHVTLTVILGLVCLSMTLVVTLQWQFMTQQSTTIATGTTATTTTRATATATATTRNENEWYIKDLLMSNKKHLPDVPPRAFLPWPRNRPLPCFSPLEDIKTPQQQAWNDRPVLKQAARQGLFFLKLCKTASSTAASVHLRIARNVRQRLQPQHDNWPICKARFLHGWAGPRMYQFDQRHPTQSFLWTILRQPTERYVSEFWHFQVTRKNTSVTADAFERFLTKGPHADHHSLSWLSTTGYNYPKDNSVVTANAIIRDYDFIALAERFDESIVVLTLLLGVPLRDALYLSSKTLGGYDGLCYKIQKGHLDEPMQRLLTTDEWQTYIQPEVALYQAANTSLDLTIQQLGHDRVQAQLKLFQKVQAAVQAKCAPITKFPCTSTGQPNNQTDCLLVDMGCGLDCIDAVADQFNLPTFFVEE